jgi:hypothetical protein
MIYSGRVAEPVHAGPNKIPCGTCRLSIVGEPPFQIHTRIILRFLQARRAGALLPLTVPSVIRNLALRRGPDSFTTPIIERRRIPRDVGDSRDDINEKIRNYSASIHVTAFTRRELLAGSPRSPSALKENPFLHQSDRER